MNNKKTDDLLTAIVAGVVSGLIVEIIKILAGLLIN